MTKEQTKIFIADEQMEFNMKRYPDYVDFKDGLEKEGFEVISMNQADKTMLDNKSNTPLVSSDLFLHDKYYSLVDCVERYITDLAVRMEELVKFMGASEWYFDYKDEKSNSNKESCKQEITIGGKAKYGGTDISSSATNVNQSAEVQSSSIKRTTKLKGPKKEPKELAQYIKEEGINLDAFGGFFKKTIEDYIKGEPIVTNETDIDKTEQITHYVEIGKAYALNPKIKVVDAKLKLNLQDKFGNEHKYRTKFHYKMTFE